MSPQARRVLAWGVLLAGILIGTLPLLGEGPRESGGIEKTYKGPYVLSTSLQVKSITVIATLRARGLNQLIALGSADGGVSSLPDQYKSARPIAVIQVFEFPGAALKGSSFVAGPSEERTVFGGDLELVLASAEKLPELLLVVPQGPGKPPVTVLLPGDGKSQIRQDGFDLLYEKRSEFEVHLTIMAWPRGDPIIMAV